MRRTCSLALAATLIGLSALVLTPRQALAIRVGGSGADVNPCGPNYTPGCRQRCDRNRLLCCRVVCVPKPNPVRR